MRVLILDLHKAGLRRRTEPFILDSLSSLSFCQASDPLDYSVLGQSEPKILGLAIK